MENSMPEYSTPDDFSKPNFLGETHHPKSDLTFAKGSIITIRHLDELPPNILEKTSGLENSETGYVIKQYNKDFSQNFSRHDSLLFSNDNSSLFSYFSQHFKKFSIVDEATILQKRQDELKRYFGKDGEVIIVPSKFFIAQDAEKDFFIYEIQKRLPPFFHLDECEGMDLGYLSEEQKKNLISEAQKLIEVLTRLVREKEDPVFKNFIPDLHSKNIAITEDGHVRIFDTNFFVVRWEEFATTGVIMTSILQLRELVIRLSNQ